MSNLVIWKLLHQIILKNLEILGKMDLMYDVEEMEENHPLILYLERRLIRLFTPIGGLSCPELEKMILEALGRDRRSFERTIFLFIKEYLNVSGVEKIGLEKETDKRKPEEIVV